MKTILITGASSGIGKATAETFADRGWNVVATMRNASVGADLAARDNVLVVDLNVQRPESIPAAIEAGIARFGGLDVLLNNAGIAPMGSFEELYRTRGRETFEVNVFGVMEVTQAVLPHFRARRKGLIVNVSSAAGLLTFPLGTLYDATKFALEGFTEALAYEVNPLGIGVKLIEPGLVRTRMTETFKSDVTPEQAIDDYRAFSEHTLGLFNGMMAGEVPSADTVARRIYDAITDGTDRLRYLVTEDAETFVAARRAVTDEEHVTRTRAMFALPTA
jgi:NAD(P)-dependent dehydrogenase (short-subunit alcohol dehydrogenase family)